MHEVQRLMGEIRDLLPSINECKKCLKNKKEQDDLDMYKRLCSYRKKRAEKDMNAYVSESGGHEYIERLQRENNIVAARYDHKA